MALKITESDLRQFIVDELSQLREGVDHEGVKHVVTAASKLLKACEAFKDDPTVAMTNATTPHLDKLISVLESMISAPGSYVNPAKPKPKKVVKLRRSPE